MEEVFGFLKPNSSDFIDRVEDLSNSTLGSLVNFFDPKYNLSDFPFSIICVDEYRGNHNSNTNADFKSIKLEFYQLLKGNWSTSILDLGYIISGDEISDTYYVLQNLVKQILKANSIPIILGGSQDLTYAQYRAYDGIKYMVNMSNVDYKFDLGDSNESMNNESYLSHIIVNKPYNLFNYSNLGYQTYFNAQEEIELLEKMFFESYRLGELTSNIKNVEPILRDADILTIDMRAIEGQSVLMDGLNVNGFNNREICILSRYAGLSDKVSSLGIYELQYLKTQLSHQLIAQILWYFFEGTMYRLNEEASVNNTNFIKYRVPIDNETLVFYESKMSGRWWIEIPSNLDNHNNKLKQHTLLPCDKETYLSACDQELPDRWYKARQKNEF